jgi:uncharacterized protein DUF5648
MTITIRTCLGVGILALLSSLSIAQAPPKSVTGVNLAGFESKNSKRFMMTVSKDEENSIWASKQWNGLGVLAYVFGQQVQGAVPLYRYMNPKSGDHFFTTNHEEGDNAINSYGYVGENQCCFVSSSKISGTLPLYRVLKGSYHWYAVGDTARDNLIAKGFKLEGIEGYVWDSSKFGSSPPTALAGN